VGEIKIVNDIIKGKRILITGSTGFIGSHLLRSLKGTASLTAAFYGDPPVITNKGVNWKELDITDSTAVKKLIVKEQPQIVFHLGALLGAERSYEFTEKALVTNTLGTHNLLSVLGTHCKYLEKVVLLGTSEEYGNSKDIPFTEDHPVHPVSPYSVSKAAATQLAILYHELFQLPLVILRPFILYGPGQSPKMMIPELIKYGIENKDFPMTKGEQTRDFLYIDDFIKSLLSAALSSDAVGEIINICSGTEKSIIDVAELVHRLMKAKMKLLVGACPYRDNEVWRLFGNNEKAKLLLGWQPEISLEEGLSKTIFWYRNQTESSRYEV
jgi:nucleoside-diphosphate-sugar epimerase